MASRTRRARRSWRRGRPRTPRLKLTGRAPTVEEGTVAPRVLRRCAAGPGLLRAARRFAGPRRRRARAHERRRRGHELGRGSGRARGPAERELGRDRRGRLQKPAVTRSGSPPSARTAAGGERAAGAGTRAVQFLGTSSRSAGRTASASSRRASAAAAATRARTRSPPAARRWSPPAAAVSSSSSTTAPPATTRHRRRAHGRRLHLHAPARAGAGRRGRPRPHRPADRLRRPDRRAAAATCTSRCGPLPAGTTAANRSTRCRRCWPGTRPPSLPRTCLAAFARCPRRLATSGEP